MPSSRIHTRLARLSREFAPLRRVWTGVLTAFGVLIIGLAAHSPEAHEHVHHDATHPGHVCAITLAAAGFCDTAAPAPDVGPTAAALVQYAARPGSFTWTTPDFWLTPALAPPARLV